MTTLFDRVFKGSDGVYERAEAAVKAAIEKHGPDYNAAFPQTAYGGLPCLHAFTGLKIATLADLQQQGLPAIKAMLKHEKRTNDVFTSGIGSALSAEVIEAMKYVEGSHNYDKAPLHGHLSDAEIRELGVPLVTDAIPGVAVIIGPAPSKEEAVALVKSYQSLGIIVFLVGGIIKQCEEMELPMGFPIRIVPLGYELSSVVHVVSVALRAALIFGAEEPGDWDAMCEYTMKRIHAFVNAFAPVDDETTSYGGGAIALGFPVITNDPAESLASVPKSLVKQYDTAKFHDTSLEARDIKIQITNIDIPVAFATAFEGEIIRKGDMQIEADGSRVDCFELLQTKNLGDVEDHKIEVIGSEIDAFAIGSKINMAIVVDVAGKAMKSDFEPVIERKFHSWINCAEGIMHTGQRDMIRIRISKNAFAAGFRAKHFGEILYAKIKSEFASIVDKCAVTIYTEPAKVTELRHSLAIAAFDKRDERLQSLTDENVKEFYTCILCQSFSPSHVCIVTPERLGLCGAVSWLDAKATNELQPNGPCQVVPKDGVIDDVTGRWESVNTAVQQHSQGMLESVSLYSILEDPMTSCGCFECICAIEPMSGGVLIVNREHSGMTPMGMTFPELASMTGGGVQTPGFMGHGRHFIASKKFMKAEGGVARIVWMPKELKESVAAKLNATAKDLYGIDDFTSMIADETITTDPEQLIAFLTEKGHPVLNMDPLI